MRTTVSINAPRAVLAMIETTLVLSTAHVAQSAIAALDADAIDGLIYHPKGEYGWTIYVAGDVDGGDVETGHASLDAAIELARALKVTWLCLDRDGEMIPDLSTFD